MGYHILTKESSSYNTPICEFWCDSTADIANLPTDVPVGSICQCQIAPVAPETKSTLKIYMFHKTADNAVGHWYEI